MQTKKVLEAVAAKYKPKIKLVKGKKYSTVVMKFESKKQAQECFAFLKKRLPK